MLNSDYVLHAIFAVLVVMMFIARTSIATAESMYGPFHYTNTWLPLTIFGVATSIAIIIVVVLKRRKKI